MADLRTLPEVLLARGDIVTPPMATVVRRARIVQVRRRSMTVALALVLAVLAPSVAEWVTDGDPSSHVRLVDRTTTTTTMAALPGPGGPPEFVVGMGPSASPEGPSSTTTTTTGTPSKPLECRAGANGGATDVGVTENSVRIAMTETMAGPVRYATATAYTNVSRLFDYVNDRGGICGRLIRLRMANDVWRPLPWDDQGDMVAGIAGPFDPAVDKRILDGSVDRAAMPLVGTDGLSAAQHRSPWVWPIGPATASYTRIAVDHAYREDGAQTFALVYDRNEPVGRQAAAALRDYVGRLHRAELTQMQALDSTDQDFKDEAEAFDLRCRINTCDFVLFALTPETARKWMDHKPTTGGKRTATLPLLDNSFWTECETSVPGPWCKNFRVWVSYPRYDHSYWTGPLSPCKYVTSDPFAAIANLSGCTLLKALERVGPDVTRARLREAIDQVSYESQLVGPFRDGRRAPDFWAGQAAAEAWEPKYTFLGKFARLEAAGTGMIRDPLPGLFPEE